MKDWQTPKPSGPVHPDSVRNQERREKEAARAARFSDPKYYLKLLATWSAIIAFVGVFVVAAIVNAPTPEERAAIKAAQDEAERVKAEAERQAQQREAANAAKRNRETRLVDQCQNGIKAMAKVPRSVDFHFGYDFQDFPGGHAMVAQTFDAINGFGQKTTNEGRCVFDGQGELLEFWWNGVRQL